MGYRDEEVIMWNNGQLITAGQATFPVLDHGLTVGDGVFEAVKVINGHPFALHLHHERIQKSARLLGIKCPGFTELDNACEAVLEANMALLMNSTSLMRITVTAGTGEVGSGRIQESAPRLLVTLTYFSAPSQVTTCITAPWTRNENGATTGVKTISYAENAKALARARERGATEALFANTKGKLCEGTHSNVFLVLDDELITPPLRDGMLAGITRALVIEWFRAQEQSVFYETLFRAEEVFLTSSGFGIMGVAAIDGRPIGCGTIGPITAQIAQEFSARESRFDGPLDQ